jgi:hypothetical protein
MTITIFYIIVFYFFTNAVLSILISVNLKKAIKKAPKSFDPKLVESTEHSFLFLLYVIGNSYNIIRNIF